MKQSRAMSLVEAVVNVAVGYGVAVATQILIFPVFGLHTTPAQNLKIGAVFTVVSVARSFALRRLFESIRVRSVPSQMKSRCSRTRAASFGRPFAVRSRMNSGGEKGGLSYSSRKLRSTASASDG